MNHCITIFLKTKYNSDFALGAIELVASASFAIEKHV
jgi:hypothetical protein